jgi:hypothetical protein
MYTVFLHHPTSLMGIAHTYMCVRRGKGVNITSWQQGTGKSMKTFRRYETKFLRSYALLEMHANTHGTKRIKSSSSSLIDWTNISKIKLVAKTPL